MFSKFLNLFPRDVETMEFRVCTLFESRFAVKMLNKVKNGSSISTFNFK